MCLSILPKVNGIITPKLPVYNRLQAKKFSRNTRIQASANEMKRKVEALKAVNTLTEMDIDNVEIEMPIDAHETRSVVKKKQAVEYMKKSFPTTRIPILPRVSLPKPYSFPPTKGITAYFRTGAFCTKYSNLAFCSISKL